MKTIQHIHHISAIVGNAQENVDFYRDVLQLRLVKQTVNFDDSSVYHLYFGNQKAEDGSLMTFFPWDKVAPGQKGSGQVGHIAFRLPKGSIDYWKKRLVVHQVSYKESKWFDHQALFFQDRHGLNLALVEGDEVAEEAAILGFHGAELLSSNPEGSKDFLTAFMGLDLLAETESAYHLVTIGVLGHEIIIPKHSLDKGTWGPGTVHHIAWNVLDQEELVAYAQLFKNEGYYPTSERDRKYFRSIYLRESGHIIYEFATQGPGMTVDEPFEELGKNLQLSKVFENRRAAIMEKLKPLK